MMTDSEYKALINRYFAGDTTVEEERLLLRELLERRPEPGSLEAEALAVMTFGRFQAPASASRRRRRLPRMRLWLSTAAAGLLAAFPGPCGGMHRLDRRTARPRRDACGRPHEAAAP